MTDGERPLVPASVRPPAHGPSMRYEDLRQRVYDRLANGLLRSSYVVAGMPDTVRIRMTIGGGPLDEPCAVCDERGTDFWYEAKPRAAFHEACHAVWEDAVRTRLQTHTTA